MYIGIAENVLLLSSLGATARVNAPDVRTALRSRLRAARDALAPSARIDAASRVVTSLERLPEFSVDERVAGYWAVRGELALHVALASLRRRGQTYHLPLLDADQSLRFAPWQAGDPITANRYGIPEPRVAEGATLDPASMELVLVPLLGFDRRGNRLGSGAGYYDRSFAFLRNEQRPGSTLLVGIGYSFQEVESLQTHRFDVAMDFIATEEELIDCTHSPE